LKVHDEAGEGVHIPHGLVPGHPWTNQSNHDRPEPAYEEEDQTGLIPAEQVADAQPWSRDARETQSPIEKKT
jgi:hypothetical protein